MDYTGYLQKIYKERKKGRWRSFADQNRAPSIRDQSRDSESCRLSSSVAFAYLFFSSLDMTDFTNTLFPVFGFFWFLHRLPPREVFSKFYVFCFRVERKIDGKNWMSLAWKLCSRRIKLQKLLKYYLILRDIQARYVLKKHTTVFFDISPSLWDINQSQLLSVNAKICTSQGDSKNTSFHRRRRDDLAKMNWNTCELEVITFNVGGLGIFPKRKDVFGFLRCQTADAVCLQ